MSGVFLSTFRNKLDKKRRVSVPAQFRAVLSSQNFQGIVAFRSLVLSAVEGFGMDRMEKLSAHMDKLDLFSDAQQDWSGIFADSHSLSFDGDGRIVLPEVLCEHAFIEDEVMFVGCGPTFQIWSPEKFDEHIKNARERLRTKSKTLIGALS
ncbi:division/cell wall cluster transcriptional repressor MraZ [Candidatus Hydrogenosomobacter endosymbioticus]|uniref:Transcriptional regulator MraZ n=1 Tax=Candidatus Hydrogenosomobacter endosymbioticus TaxID=2558174 RepID=A0ABM7V8W1_9PROT|nr:division/cell wall cluster transcriptional repressor MraZ [Candidatus Hydrogenosomobacter endosymbioticus]BDB96240.1 transcriptional regulator MraZ [Candidatus Hydrogenosomobacter endosymbioticus]